MKLSKMKMLEVRRIKDFPDKDLIGSLSGLHKNSAMVRERPAGKKMGEGLLNDYHALAERVLNSEELRRNNLTQADLDTYCRINRLISHQLRPKHPADASSVAD